MWACGTRHLHCCDTPPESSSKGERIYLAQFQGFGPAWWVEERGHFMVARKRQRERRERKETERECLPGELSCPLQSHPGASLWDGDTHTMVGSPPESPSDTPMGFGSPQANQVGRQG
jgi:hypothetical protein